MIKYGTTQLCIFSQFVEETWKENCNNQDNEINLDENFFPGKLNLERIKKNRNWYKKVNLSS